MDLWLTLGKNYKFQKMREPNSASHRQNMPHIFFKSFQLLQSLKLFLQRSNL